MPVANCAPHDPSRTVTMEGLFTPRGPSMIERLILRTACLMIFCGALNLARAADPPLFRALDGTEKPVKVVRDGLRQCIDYRDLRVTADSDLEIGDSLYAGQSTTAECKAGSPLGPVIIQDDESTFLGKVGRFLIIDQGTGPEPRGLVLLEFATRRSAYSDLYDLPIAVRDGVLHYWRPTDIKATKTNCPKYDQIVSDGFIPAIERYVEIDLNTAALVRTESQKLRCHADQ